MNLPNKIIPIYGNGDVNLVTKQSKDHTFNALFNNDHMILVMFWNFTCGQNLYFTQQ